MQKKRPLRALLLPPIPLLCTLVPVATALLVFSMTVLGTNSLIAYLSYVLAAYTLTAVCLRIPQLICLWRRLRLENRHVQRWFSDVQLRTTVSLYVTAAACLAYALLQLGLGILHRSFWFYSIAGYYALLASMRLFMLRYTRGHLPGDDLRAELRCCRTCGTVLLAMNLTLTLMIFFMVYWGRTFYHHEITTITIAAYTFTALTVAILQAVRHRHSDSPIYQASATISLAAACVSLLTLETTMLTTFGADTDPTTRKLLLAISGGAVSLLIILMAVRMILRSTNKLKEQHKEHHNGTKA